jgi:hypothetical protein
MISRSLRFYPEGILEKISALTCWSRVPFSCQRRDQDDPSPSILSLRSGVRYPAPTIITRLWLIFLLIPPGFPQSLSSGDIRTSKFQEIAKAPRSGISASLRQAFALRKPFFQHALHTLAPVWVSTRNLHVGRGCPHPRL